MAQETTLQTRSLMIQLKQQGLAYSQIAQRLGLSTSCVKKFWRRFLHRGEQGLNHLSRRPQQSPEQMSTWVRQLILQTKQRHPLWGAQFIQGELRRQRVKAIPHRRTIERFLDHFPELPQRQYQKRAPLEDARRARRLHQLWQIDFKVKYQLHGAPKKYSFLNMRDMASTTSILKYTLPAGRSALTSHEVISVCREAFGKCGHLPEAIRTDHGACFCAPEKDSFPTDFTLYLWGLSITHELIAVGKPAQNGGIERDQRTFREHFLADYQFRTQHQLEQDAEAFGHFQNQFVPSRSVRCQGKTAREVATQLECQARAYKPHREAKMFDTERIYDQLAKLTWRRVVSANGYIHLGHYKYYAGRGFSRQQVCVHFDRARLELVLCSAKQAELKRWPIRGISYEEIVKDRKSNQKQKSYWRSWKKAA